MRKTVSCVCLISLLFLAIWTTTSAMGEPSEGKDLIPAGSIWTGSVIQTGYDKPYPVVFYVNKRDVGAFELDAWYPSLDNGLVRGTGLIEAGGEITVREESVILGKKVVAAVSYSGKLVDDEMIIAGKFASKKEKDGIGSVSIRARRVSK